MHDKMHPTEIFAGLQVWTRRTLELELPRATNQTSPSPSSNINHNGQETLKKENARRRKQPCHTGSGQWPCQLPRPEEHGDPDRRRRGWNQCQPARCRCAACHGARDSNTPERAQGEQVTRLRYHVRSIGCHPPPPVLEVRVRKYQFAPGGRATRSDIPLQS